LLEQQADGTLVDASARLLGDAFTHGAGSVIVADFNGDGLDDLVLPAHNESPFLWEHSTAWISRPAGGLDRITLADNVMDHDARLVVLDGKKKIFARSFGGSGVNGQGAGFNVLYSWTGNTLVADAGLGDLGGQSVLAGPFAGNAESWLIIGDSRGGGPGGTYAATNPMLNYAYKYVAGAAVTPRVELPKPYFNDKPAYAGFDSQWDPYSKTHTSRLWTTTSTRMACPTSSRGRSSGRAAPPACRRPCSSCWSTGAEWCSPTTPTRSRRSSARTPPSITRCGSWTSTAAASTRCSIRLRRASTPPRTPCGTASTSW
jgi:hypothetical protein